MEGRQPHPAELNPSYWLRRLANFIFGSVHDDPSFEDGEKSKSDNEQDLCPICTEELSTHPCLSLPCNTKHVFHTTCIQDWAARNPVCPYDRESIPPEALIPNFNTFFNKSRFTVSVFAEALIDGTSVYLWIYHISHEPVLLFSRLIIAFFSAKCAEWLVSANSNTNSPWLFESTKALLHVLMTYVYGFNKETLHYIIRNSIESNGKLVTKRMITFCNFGYDYRVAKSFSFNSLAKLGGFLLGLFVVGNHVRQQSDRLVSVIIQKLSEHIAIPYNP